MKNEKLSKKTFLGGALVGAMALGLVTAGAYSTSAQNEDGQTSSERGPQTHKMKMSEEVRAEIIENDYEGFIEASEIEFSERLRERVDEEKFAEMHERVTRKEAGKTALESGDYESFKASVAGTPVEEILTEENFSQFVAMHQAMEAEDFDTAKAIAAELGLKKLGKGREFSGNPAAGERPEGRLGMNGIQKQRENQNMSF